MAVIQSAPQRGLAAVVREAMRGGTHMLDQVDEREAHADISGLGMEL